MKDDITFENSLKKLEETAEALENDDITLQAALDNYEKGVEYFKACEEILKSANQRIEKVKK